MGPLRALRIGVVLGDRVVDERMFTGETPVTFGQSLKCALSVPVDGVPREHVLCELASRGSAGARSDAKRRGGSLDDGRFVLRLAPGMEGRLAVDGGTVEVVRGPSERVLGRGARGKLTIGEATILLQEVARPAPQPRPQLPASVRGTLADRIDSRLAMIVGASLVVHLAIALWAWQGDVEHDVPLGMPPVAEQPRQEPIDVTVPDLDPAPAPGVATPASRVQTPTPIVRPPHVTTPATHPMTGDDAARLASILASSDTAEHGPAGMSPRHPGADLDKQIDEVRNRKITIGDGGHTSRVDDRARIGTGTDELPVGDPTLTRAPDHHEDAASSGRIKLGPVVVEHKETITTADSVISKIEALYRQGIRRCYAKGLAGDATLHGKLSIAFTIDERGHVIDPEASGLDDQVAACVQAQMANWTFTPPRDHAGALTEASFQISLILHAD